MLKGTMTIEMTDVKTGKTEKVLEHNMVTNALTEIFKPRSGKRPKFDAEGICSVLSEAAGRYPAF